MTELRRRSLPNHLRYLADALIRACETLDGKQMPPVGGVAINLQVLADEIERGDFVRSPVQRERLDDPCHLCGRPLDASHPAAGCTPRPIGR